MEHQKCKCLRCGRFYSKMDNPDCVFHGGKYRQDEARAGWITSGVWLCCGATNKNAPGCKKRTDHIEDVRTTQILNQFNSSASTSGDDSYGLAAGWTKKGNDDEHKDELLLSKPVHAVDAEIKYGARANLGLKNTDLLIKKAMGASLPPNYEQQLASKQSTKTSTDKSTANQFKIGLIKQFIEKTGKNHEEAKFYLEDNAWNLEDAIANFDEDTKWEASKGQIQKATRHQEKKKDIEEQTLLHSEDGIPLDELSSASAYGSGLQPRRNTRAFVE
eukprot:TRINITY_DN7984_c0_g1_i2.p1 TRINITY_DN7984_c0_g1~~TRINITY_DN7984_c0_g1_i2.p1  ORF type:complete len:274 (-),score=77.26 TRINITY_DN7984_c0_g1_i2:85-906(-)